MTSFLRWCTTSLQDFKSSLHYFLRRGSSRLRQQCKVTFRQLKTVSLKLENFVALASAVKIRHNSFVQTVNMLRIYCQLTCSLGSMKNNSYFDTTRQRCHDSLSKREAYTYSYFSLPLSWIKYDRLKKRLLRWDVDWLRVMCLCV